MKRNVYFVLLLCLFLLLAVCSCNKADNIFQANSQSNNDSYTSKVYHFNTYDELKNAFVSNTEDNKMLKREMNVFGEQYEKYLDHYTDADFLIFPQIEGEYIPLRDLEGFHNISLMPNETYHLPWIWYFVKHDSQEIIVNMLYTSFLENESITESMSASRLIKIVYPDAVDPENYTEHSEIYKNVYERQIVLKDKTVSAVVYEFTDDERIWVTFVYDGALVRLRGRPSLLTDDFFSKLSFE